MSNLSLEELIHAQTDIVQLLEMMAQEPSLFKTQVQDCAQKSLQVLFFLQKQLEQVEHNPFLDAKQQKLQQDINRKKAIIEQRLQNLLQLDFASNSYLVQLEQILQFKNNIQADIEQLTAIEQASPNPTLKQFLAILATWSVDINRQIKSVGQNFYQPNQ
jgi:hypothetical protein